MKVPFNDLGRQYATLQDEIVPGVLALFQHGHFIGGAPVKEFEKEFARAQEAAECVGVANGTDGLLLCFKALGVKPGDKIITSATSFVATAEAIAHAGAEPVFVDIDPATSCLDIAEVERMLARTSGIVGIVPVHLYGRAVNMPKLSAIAKAAKVWIVEDAAQAHLARTGGKAIGAESEFTTFSFYPGKNLGAYGDAGAVTANSPELAAKVRKLANHGRTSKYAHDLIGYNSRLDTIQARILSIKLARLAQWTEQRVRIAQTYDRALQKLAPQLVTPAPAEPGGHVYHLYVVRTPQRDSLQKYLHERNVETLIHYPIAIPFLEIFGSRYQPNDFPHSHRLQEEALSLPIFPEMTSDELNYVIGCVQDFFATPK